MTEYDLQAENFLKKAGARMHISLQGEVRGFPFDKKDTLWHNKYQVAIIRNKQVYRFQFYGSFHDFQTNRRPSHYDVLACLVKYEVPYDVRDFANEFGYDIDDDYEEYQRVCKIHQACRKQYKRLYELFGEELMEELQEII